MAHLLAELSEGRLLNQEHTAQLLSYMQDTNYEDLIPAAVPAGVTVFHNMDSSTTNSTMPPSSPRPKGPTSWWSTQKAPT